MPFVQGHLTHEPVSIAIASQCAHCSREIHFEVNDALAYQGPDTAGLVTFVPIVNFKKLKEPNIIDAF